MTRENSNESLNTIKGHGLSVGDRFTFHGMASDPTPAAEGTRVALGKVGNKYMITTVTGEVMTWEFGPSAKIWADTTAKHGIIVDSRTMDNGDTVYAADCEHGWQTGLHTSAEDAYAVAEAHGKVSRPLYVAPVAEVTPVDPHKCPKHGGYNIPGEAWCAGCTMDALITEHETTNAGKRMIAVAHSFAGKSHAVGTAIYAYAFINSIDDQVRTMADVTPVIEVTPADITGAEVEMARVAVRDNGRVFAAEVHNFGGQAAFDILVESGTHTLVNDGDMSRYIRTMRTADGEPITDGMAVWDYNLDAGRVDLSTAVGDGWFNVDTVKGTRSLMNGERVFARHPFSRVAAEAEVSMPPVTVDAPDTMTTPTVPVADGEAETDAFELPASPGINAEVDAMRAGIDPYADQITEDVWTGAGVVVTASGKTLWTETRNGVTRVKGERGTYTEWDAAQFGALLDLGVLSRPEVRLSPRVRALVNRRKRKASKVNARRVKGGF